MNNVILTQIEAEKTDTKLDKAINGEINFGDLDQLTATRAIIYHLEVGNDLTFVEQCVLFTITLAQLDGVMTRETIESMIGNHELWGEIQTILPKMAQSFPTSWQMHLSEMGAVMCGFNPDGSDKQQGETQSKNPTKCYTYIVRKRGTVEIKIGRSIQVEKRIRTLERQSGATLDVLAIIPQNIETALHKKFAEFRTLGEWFDDSKGLIANFAKEQGVVA